MIWLAVYDIDDDSERAKVASILQAWGFVRVQRSFYVGRLPRGRVQDLARLVARALKGSGHVAFIPATGEQLGNAEWGANDMRRLDCGQPRCISHKIRQGGRLAEAVS